MLQSILMRRSKAASKIFIFSAFSGFTIYLILQQCADVHATPGIQDIGLHRVTLPAIKPLTNSNCNKEAAAYASALAALHDARRVADEAYRRWYDCEMHGGGNGPGPLPMNQGHLQVHSPIPPSSWSILIDSETAEQESNLVATTP